MADDQFGSRGCDPLYGGSERKMIHGGFIKAIEGNNMCPAYETYSEIKEEDPFMSYVVTKFRFGREEVTEVLPEAIQRIRNIPKQHNTHLSGPAEDLLYHSSAT